MTLTNTSKTTVKIGRCDFPLEKVVNKFEEPLTPLNIGLGNTVKYKVLKYHENSYLLIISQQKERIIDPKTGHNTILTVTSRSYQTNSEISKRFQEQTGIILDLPVPDYLIDNFNILNLAFPTF